MIYQGQFDCVSAVNKLFLMERIEHQLLQRSSSHRPYTLQQITQSHLSPLLQVDP